MSEAPTVPLTPKWQARKPLRELRARHHAVAQLVVQGRKVSEISRQTGYSPTYVSRIQKDPVMQELLAHYVRQREEAFSYALGRKLEIALGLDELRDRLGRRAPRRGPSGRR
jgi:hypothetical protein